MATVSRPLEYQEAETHINPTTSQLDGGNDIQARPGLPRDNEELTNSSAALSLLPRPIDGVPLSTGQLAGLYFTHSLSMWNSRSYEFASVLFTTSAYPNDLTVASLRGLSANFASLVFSPAVGRWCNRYPSRLGTLQISIIFQRICIFVACLIWPWIVQSRGVDHHEPADPSQSNWSKHGMLAMLIVLGMLEKLFAIANLLVMEQDWVPLLATPDSDPPLHILNASIKRIDLVSKLLAPLAISGAALGMGNLRSTALLIAFMQLVSVVPEIYSARRVYKSSQTLQVPRTRRYPTLDDPQMWPLDASLLSRAKAAIAAWTHSLRIFANSPACVPSLCLAAQPFSVLTLSASMTVYLLAAHYPLAMIASARTVSTVIELCSTVIAPWLISKLRTRYHEQDTFKSLFIVGIWGLVWQLSWIAPAVAMLVLLPSDSPDPTHAFPLLTTLLLLFLSLSRLGPFAYGLVEQQIVQTTVPTTIRVEFSGVEAGLISFAELSRWGLTGIFGAMSQFKGVATASLFVLTGAAILFETWRRTWWDKLDQLRSAEQDSEEP